MIGNCSGSTSPPAPGAGLAVPSIRVTAQPLSAEVPSTSPTTAAARRGEADIGSRSVGAAGAGGGGRGGGGGRTSPPGGGGGGGGGGSSSLPARRGGGAGSPRPPQPATGSVL